MYSLEGYGHMIADRVRIDAYSRALRCAIRPGSVVLEIGTGPGVLAVLACELGASRVYAIESESIIQVAREIAGTNHCADRIEFFEALSTKVELPVRADVVVSDLRGILPLFEQHISSIVDARTRLLTPGGVLIPRRDLIWVTVVEAPETYEQVVSVWESNLLRQDLTAARKRIVNDIRKATVAPDQLLAKPQLWATLDYGEISGSDVNGRLEWVTERAGTGHGLLAWFETDLIDGIGFSNAPGESETVYGSLFFPWTGPVRLVAGQSVSVDLQAKLLDNDYVWRWSTRIPSSGSEPAVCLEQSQLQGAILSPAALHRRASDYVPQLSCEGLLHRRALELMNGATPLEEIAHQLTAEFPERFAHWHQALSYAGVVSQKFSR